MTRDGTGLGRAAGALLADTLLQLAAGERPAGPVGVSLRGREVVRTAFASHADAGAWVQTAGLVDPFLLDVARDSDEVRILVPAAGGTSFDIVWRVRYAVDDAGVVLTSEPAFTLSDVADVDELLDDVNDGIAAGLELHPRTSELRDGFGALGPYEARDV